MSDCVQTFHKYPETPLLPGQDVRCDGECRCCKIPGHALDVVKILTTYHQRISDHYNQKLQDLDEAIDGINVHIDRIYTGIDTFEDELARANARGTRQGSKISRQASRIAKLQLDAEGMMVDMQNEIAIAGQQVGSAVGALSVSTNAEVARLEASIRQLHLEEFERRAMKRKLNELDEEVLPRLV